MFEVKKTEYGLRLTLEGYVDEEEMSRYCESVRVAAEKQVGTFGVVADMREATAMPDDSAAELKELMAFCDRAGLERAAGVFESTTTALQTQRLAEDVNHADGNAVFIDAARNDDSEAAALEWVRDGREPTETL